LEIGGERILDSPHSLQKLKGAFFVGLEGMELFVEKRDDDFGCLCLLLFALGWLVDFGSRLWVFGNRQALQHFDRNLVDSC
jgi:hypothetical protein